MTEVKKKKVRRRRPNTNLTLKKSVKKASAVWKKTVEGANLSELASDLLEEHFREKGFLPKEEIRGPEERRKP